MVAEELQDLVVVDLEYKMDLHPLVPLKMVQLTLEVVEVVVVIIKQDLEVQVL
jgi:hypothetical protein|tara:strand:- start:42 stop:200 length:159 start_codon:yes stop_codon:yes gene_type:complete